jgi:hypothetical protein
MSKRVDLDWIGLDANELHQDSRGSRSDEQLSGLDLGNDAMYAM